MARVFTPVCYAVLFLLGLQPLHAQEKGKEQAKQPSNAPSNYEHLKPLQWMVGNWVTEGKAEKDKPGSYKKGDSLKQNLGAFWVAGRNAITVRSSVFANGKLVNSSQGIIGWNPAKKVLFSTSFWSDGRTSTGNLNVQNGSCKAKVEGIDGEGKKMTWTLHFSEISGYSFAVQARDIKVENKDLSDGQKLIYKRLTTPPSAEDTAKIQGKWKGKLVYPTPKVDYTLEKQLEGDKETVRYLDKDGKVLSAHTTNYKVGRTKDGTIFTFAGLELIDGPNKGNKMEGARSYFYRLDGDNLYEIHGFHNSEGGSPALILWKRINN